MKVWISRWQSLFGFDSSSSTSFPNSNLPSSLLLCGSPFMFPPILHLCVLVLLSHVFVWTCLPAVFFALKLPPPRPSDRLGLFLRWPHFYWNVAAVILVLHIRECAVLFVSVWLAVTGDGITHSLHFKWKLHYNNIQLPLKYRRYRRPNLDQMDKNSLAWTPLWPNLA